MGLGGGTISNCLGTLQTLVATRTDVGYAGYDFPRLYAPPPPPEGVGTGEDEECARIVPVRARAQCAYH